MASSSVTQGKVFTGHGLRRSRLIGTILLVIGIVAFVFWVALHEGVSAIGSTIAALLFIGGFVYYLCIVVPVPFVLRLEADKIVKQDRRGEIIEVRWEDLTRVKEEFFKSGTSVSVGIYRRTTEPGQKAKAWTVYRDDVDDFDGLVAALKQAIPATCQWQNETVHD